MREKRPQIVRNARQQMSGYALLRALPQRSAKLVFLDPQYRSVLDKLKYGNEGKRQKARAALRQMTDHDIACFVEQIERILAPSGHLMMWVDKFAIGSGHHLRYLRYGEKLHVVDLISWNKGRPGMGRRTRCWSEYLVVVQREPLRAKDIWTDHRIADAWIEYADRSIHAHAKPYQLTERLIRATTRRGDLVVDPCAGGYGVLQACRASGREFVGCDIV